MDLEQQEKEIGNNAAHTDTFRSTETCYQCCPTSFINKVAVQLNR